MMDAEIEVVDGVVEGELVESGRPGLIERARGAVTDPRVQGAAAATAGMMVGAATMALMKRAGLASAVRNASPNPVGPSSVAWPAGPTVGPIAPGTYIVRVRAVGGQLPPQRQSQ
jgi:hypothetical protein